MGSISGKLCRRLSFESVQKRREKPNLSKEDGKLITTVWHNLKMDIANIGTMAFVW